ncbi:class I SAM-dependent methyltransferase [Corynebacterium oculi]|uniref:Arsenite S-adenosylmethyltransferase n=1 Tax=Corynebacterium oculi TaxID=1544416 RepID=A0A0Q0YCE4_9CORY|nr:methyltransferase domain-containing protein [Corynebacterium oculi]KQB83847.1 arsenite S-adenosylmethyltransferase [Corynebacterium oculi]
MSDVLPMPDRRVEDLPGHWLLARLGKRVLRPGGRELTEKLIAGARTGGADVVELAPGLGKTARLLLDTSPASYRGVDEDPESVALTGDVVGAAGVVTLAKAEDTGLLSHSTDVVLGEAMLTMQGAKGKDAIVSEAYRVLRGGGRYAIHELCLEPDNLDDSAKTEIRRALARSIKVNARPLTTQEWVDLLTGHGFTVISVQHAGMELLKPRRNLADEGIKGVVTIVKNLILHPAARRRVLAMRSVFNKYSDNLAAIAVVAVKEDAKEEML